MHYTLLFAISVVFATCQVECGTILSWIWDRTSTKESTVLVADGVPLISIPYESMTDDEKFLQEAAKFTELQVSSPLETCQHKVVMKLRTSCNEMSEEDLAKLSVNLLNCQSSVEGRKIYPCTEEMVRVSTNMIFHSSPYFKEKKDFRKERIHFSISFLIDKHE